MPIGLPLKGHGLTVNSVAFSPDGQRIVSASADLTLRLWDANTGQPIGSPLQGHKNSVTSVAFSPDGRRIVSGSWDDTLRLWDAATGKPIGSPLQGHKNSVTSVAFSPDGRRIVSGSVDNTLRLWDAATGKPIGSPLLGHKDTVWSVAFSPDGLRIVSASSDKTIRLWDVRTGKAYSVEKQYEIRQDWRLTLSIACEELEFSEPLTRLPWFNNARATCEHFVWWQRPPARPGWGAGWLPWLAGTGALAAGGWAVWGLGQRRRPMVPTPQRSQPTPEPPAIPPAVPPAAASERLPSKPGAARGSKPRVGSLSPRSAQEATLSSPAPTLQTWEVPAAQLLREALESDWTVKRSTVQVRGYHQELGQGVVLAMVSLPAGSFLMGSPPDEPERRDNEGPQHRVQLQGFFISQTPITQAQWREVASWQAQPGERWGHTLNPHPSHFQGDQGGLLPGETNTDQRPVERVSWHDAIEFCSRLRQRTGRSYTLPSEAQWEYACRAGSETPFHYGTNLIGRLQADPSSDEAISRYSFGVSFPASLRKLVEPVVERMVAWCGGDQARVLYDRYHQAIFARPNQERVIQREYRSCELLVVFLSREYLDKEWNRAEWLAAKEYLKELAADQGDGNRLMLLWSGERDDHALAELGLDWERDVFLVVDSLSPEQIWEQISSVHRRHRGDQQNRNLHMLANYNGEYAYAGGSKGEYRQQTSPVRMFPANAWGLHDMHGNVREWCLDHWHANYQEAPADGSAWLDVTEVESTAKDQKLRLLRGGSWNEFPGPCRSAYRSLSQPDYADDYVGFRVVCLPQGPSLNS